MTLTIYDVLYNFFTFAFPASVVTQFENIIDLTVFGLTYMVIFGFILIPLWRLGTFFWRKDK